MSKLVFFPDKPMTSSKTRISFWDSTNSYICQQKVDGWRMIVQFLETDSEEKEIAVVSRHNKNYTDEVLADPDIRQELERLAELVPPNTHLDGEWLSRRACSKKYNLPPQLFLFDILIWDGNSQSKTPYELRWDNLYSLLYYNDFNESVTWPAFAEPGHFEEFFEEQKQVPWTEGIVVKHKQSTLRASRSASVKNKQWYKVRYRGGMDGETLLEEFETPDEANKDLDELFDFLDE